mmetsp:Transcript_8566/g.19844  ORF Transcript_8566/g.19844 Transcript_8566/m.19844 type:complete len:217 (+) Transcript_8566:121-771(+)
MGQRHATSSGRSRKKRPWNIFARGVHLAFADGTRASCCRDHFHCRNFGIRHNISLHVVCHPIRSSWSTIAVVSFWMERKSGGIMVVVAFRNACGQCIWVACIDFDDCPGVSLPHEWILVGEHLPCHQGGICRQSYDSVYLCCGSEWDVKEQTHQRSGIYLHYREFGAFVRVCTGCLPELDGVGEQSILVVMKHNDLNQRGSSNDNASTTGCATIFA